VLGMNKQNDASYEPRHLPGAVAQNDIQTLFRAFALPDIDYTDISRQERLNIALQRWPLLAELAQDH
jgi:hypothetical protein